MSTEIVQQGFKPKEGFKAINRDYTGDLIVANHVDHERDIECDVKMSKFNLNYVFEPKDHRDRKFSDRLKAFDASTLPSKYDISTRWGKILDQGDLGSCVSNSTAYAIRECRRKAGLTPDFDASRLFIYWYGRVIEGCGANEDSGLYIRDGYKAVQLYSVCAERNWPYDMSKFPQEPSQYAQSAARQHKKFEYLKVNQELNEIKKCIADGYAISFGITVFESFMTSRVARTGIVPDPNEAVERQLGGHAITIVGYDDSTRKFKICNSWGPGWGDKGFCYLSYDYVLNPNWSDDFWTPRVFQ